uniref:tRNA-specific adenosine deaminase 1 n=1 Tax=Anopheles atroparvus TaxID=41427 RepID=A0AAG5DT63_ANOAO
MDASLANRIAEESLIKFERLPKTGKPNEEFEWTILAAIALVVRTPTYEPTVRVVALGTGTKCLGGSELSPRGDLVNDSHAEVLARRAFLRYLLEQIEAAVGTEELESVFQRSRSSGGTKFTLKAGHSFHFFTTHSPCGDASIFERSDGAGETDDESNHDQATPAKRSRTDVRSAGIEKENVGNVVAGGGEEEKLSDAADGKTGGKLLYTEEDGDLMAQTIGAIRTKPGRGVRTLSVSCSDKLARWSVLGVQGALLMLLLERPIYLESIVLCAGTDYSAMALQRAIWGRFDRTMAEDAGIIHPPYRRCMPVVIAAKKGTLFRFRKNRIPASGSAKYQPSPCGIVWCDVSDRSLEVEVSGRRHGVTKRKLATPAARLRISKIELFARFVRLYRICNGSNLGGETLNNLVSAEEHPHDRPAISDGEKRNAAVLDPSAGDLAKNEGHPEPQRRTGDTAQLSYAAAKALSVEYVRQWARVRNAAFGRWTVKPDSLGQFFVNDDTSST